MPIFPVKLWCGYFLGAGTPLYLEIDLPGERHSDAVVVAQRSKAKPAICLDKAIYENAEDDFKATLRFAFEFTARTVGWPIDGCFHVNFVPIDPRASLPDFEGGSLFGPVAIGLAQAVVRAEPECLRYPLRSLRPVLEAVRLDRVAASAAYAEATDSFAPVACIANKLDSFFLLPERPAVCVVAMGQDLNDRCGSADKTYEQMDPVRFKAPKGAGFLPVLRAYDALDALLRLWEAQSKTLANIL